jgi:hypothetical protein
MTSLTFRAETIAISDMENTPLARINTKIIKISKVMEDMFKIISMESEHSPNPSMYSR